MEDQNKKPKPPRNAVHETLSGHFTTIGGRRVSIISPTVEQIALDDIAHALSQLCRFGGHTPAFYSVAQHSILVMELAAEANEPKNIQLAALMHDATEAYVQDVIKPLKNRIGEPYEQIERRFESVIGTAFGIYVSEFHYIKMYDQKALEIEYEYFFERPKRTEFRRYFHDVYAPTLASALFQRAFSLLKNIPDGTSNTL